VRYLGRRHERRLAPFQKMSLTCLLLTGGMLMAACGSGPAAGPAQPAAGAGSPGGYPVTVRSCGTPVTFERPPARAVSNDINATEDMLALGLATRMAGDFGVTGDGTAGHPVPAPYLAAFRRVRDVSPDYFTLESLLGLRTDFLFAGWDYGLQTGTSRTPGYLARFGIRTLALSESCAHVGRGDGQISIGGTYADLTSLGAIFDVRARARRLVASMRAQVAAVRAKVAGLRPVPVFVYDSGEAAPFTAPGLAMPSALIRLGGGTDVFDWLRRSWTSVSWEQVVARRPACIIINDYGTPTWRQKRKFLETDPVTRNLPAVRHGCILPLSYDQLTPGPRNAGAVAAIARWLHPGAFGLPGRS
jgi:iron complex transport system substrate-binding protein